jgi:hypothetical protein
MATYIRTSARKPSTEMRVSCTWNGCSLKSESFGDQDTVTDYFYILLYLLPYIREIRGPRLSGI